jgi:hypothetical protein
MPGRQPQARVVLEGGGGTLFVEFDGRRIARRGPGAMKWTILVPGYTVTGGTPGDEDRLEIGYSRPDIH